MSVDQQASEAIAIRSGVEALLFSATKPITSATVAEALRDGGGEHAAETTTETVDAAIESLNESYESGGRAFRIERVAGGYRVMTLPEHAELLAAFHKSRSASKLSRAAIESLAIIAYQQPITRARLEAVRGVACGEVLRSLLDRRLIAITGRAEELGRPMLYGTTKRFLDAFGLPSLRDLPGEKEQASKQAETTASSTEGPSKDVDQADVQPDELQPNGEVDRNENR